MDSCTIETGLLRKKPCGHAAVTHCATCEQPLCLQHAVAQLTEAHKKTGKYMCKECDEARREYEKGQARVAKQELMKSVANPPPPKPKTAAPAGAPPQSAPSEKKPDAGALEFTPGEKKSASAPPENTPGEKAPDAGALEFTPREKKPDVAPLEFTPSEKKK